MIRGILAVAVLGIATLSQAWAYRVLEQTEQSYELELGAVTLPDGSNGSVIFTPCGDCRTMSMRVTEQTRYFLSGSPVELADLRASADDFRATADGQTRVAVYIFYDPASLRVTRLTLSP